MVRKWIKVRCANETLGIWHLLIKSVKRNPFVMVVVCSLLFATTACGRGESRDEKEVEGSRLCGGSAVTAEASRALEVITGSSRYRPSAERSTIARAAENVVADFPGPSVGREDICRIFTADGARPFAMRVSWRLFVGPPTDPSNPDAIVLDMGERTVAQLDQGYVQFKCESDRFPHSSKEGKISVSVWQRLKHPKPEVDDTLLKNSYATVAHSFALALAKELRCTDNGSLPERPVLEPA